MMTHFSFSMPQFSSRIQSPLFGRNPENQKKVDNAYPIALKVHKGQRITPQERRMLEAAFFGGADEKVKTVRAAVEWLKRS